MRLSATSADGSAARDSLEMRARRGSVEARALLDGPACPDSLAYLRDILAAVHGRSGVSMSGVAPLSYGTLADYARLMQVTLDPEDVEALIELDGVALDPDGTTGGG